MELNLNEQNSEFNINILLSYLRKYWKWFVASVVVCLVCAVVYLHYATQVYQVSAKVLIQDKEKGTFSSQADFLMDFGFQGTNSSVENEIEVLCSKTVVQGVEQLYGARVTARDLRGGAALVLAGLKAQGLTQVDQASLVDRGYDHLERQLASLGARIRRIDA